MMNQTFDLGFTSWISPKIETKKDVCLGVQNIQTHTIHVWYIYLHLLDFYAMDAMGDVLIQKKVTPFTNKSQAMKVLVFADHQHRGLRDGVVKRIGVVKLRDNFRRRDEIFEWGFWDRNSSIFEYEKK